MIKRTLASIVVIISVALCLNSCGKEDEVEKHKYARDVDGKVFSLEYVTFIGDGESRVDFDEEKVSEIDKAAEKALVDALAYLSDEHNEYISKINAEVDYVFDVDKDFLGMVDTAYSLSAYTGGVYKPVLSANAEGYSANGIIEITDGNVIKHDKAAKIDFGAVKESYALGCAVDSIIASGVDFAIVSYGDSVARVDNGERKQPAAIALYAVDNDDEHDGTLYLEKGYATVKTKNSEIVDAVTGEAVVPLHNTVVVMSVDSKVSSCLADCFMSMTSDQIKDLYEDKSVKFEAVIIEDDGTVVMTHGAKKNKVYETGTQTEE